MNIGKGIFRFTTTVLYAVAFVGFFTIAFMAVVTSDGLTGWDLESSKIMLLVGLYLSLIVVDVVRLASGCNLVLAKNHVKFQPVLLVFTSLAFLSLCFLAFHAFMLAAIFFVIGGAGMMIIKQSMWTIFTEIRETDHSIFKARLIKVGVLSMVIFVLLIFVIPNPSFLNNVVFPVYIAYLFSSLFIGYNTVAPYFKPATQIASAWSESEKKEQAEFDKREEESRQITHAQGGIYTAPINRPGTGFSSIFGFSIIIPMVISGLIVGMFLIPFYVYVLFTKKVTVLESLAAQ